MRLLLSLIALFLVAGAPVGAQSSSESARDREIAETDRALDDIRNEIDAGATENVRALEEDLRERLAESRARLSPVRRALAEAEESLGQLGPAPAEGEPAESEPLAARREALRERVSILQGQRTRILANIDEGVALLSALSGRRLALLYGELVKRERSLLTPGLWSDAAGGAATLHRKVTSYFDGWGSKRKGGVAVSLLALLAAFAASFVIIGPAHSWLRRTFSQRIEKLEPTSGRRVAAAGVKMVARLAPGIAGGFIIIETSRAIGLLGPDGIGVARAIWFALLAFLIVEGFTTGLFSPRAPAWRIAAVDAAKGKRASALLLALVAAFGLRSIIIAVAERAEVGPALVSAMQGLGGLLVGALLILLCRRPLWSETPAPAAGRTTSEEGNEEGGGAPRFWTFVRRAGRLLGVGLLVAPLLGYIAVADFVASRLYLLALVLAIAWFLRAALKESALWVERRLRARKDHKGEDEKEILHFWVGAGIDFVLFLAITPVVMMLAGLGWRTVRDGVWRAFIGFRVGSVSISLADIFVAIGVFFLILALTRFLQGALQRGPFKHSRLDPGIQNSLTTLLGYVGLVFAAILAVTSLGFNLSNLAIIAGALSVGIGFGLQSIVNNFVSGLILLFERPIKVGDWVITASGEGTVKKISVRSTEIETFDRSSIIVPNSELISQSVTNWTHKSKLGRITVPVGVSYGSDPEKVKEILLKCARDHSMIVRYPEPFVVWQDFGASSLDFEVRAYLRDIGEGLTVRTDLRFAIFKAFKDAGIEIPFPQQDLHIKSLPANAPAPAKQDPPTALADEEEPDEAADVESEFEKDD